MNVSIFRTQDLDEAVDVGGQLFYEHTIEPSDGTGFTMVLAHGTVGPMTAGVVKYGSPVEVHLTEPEDVYGVGVAIYGAYEVSSGGVTFVSNHSTAHIISPGHAAVMRGQEVDSVSMGLRIDREVLEAHLQGLIGRDVRGPVVLAPECDIRAGAGAQWWGIAQTVVNALRSEDSLVLNPLMTEPVSRTIMTGLLLSTEHSYREALDNAGRPIRPTIVERALRIIDERAHEPLTISGIASEVGCSVRSLQLGFMKHLQMSPGQRLERVRMDRIHWELVTGNPETTSVTEVAYRWGISPTGRFSARYRMHFGELPSTTLRRG